MPGMMPKSGLLNLKDAPQSITGVVLVTLASLVFLPLVRARVATQHRMAPPHTMAAPCQNASDSGARSSKVDSAADSTGMKYDAPASTVTLPCKMPTFQAPCRFGQTFD